MLAGVTAFFVFSALSSSWMTADGGAARRVTLFLTVALVGTVVVGASRWANIGLGAGLGMLVLLVIGNLAGQPSRAAGVLSPVDLVPLVLHGGQSILCAAATGAVLGAALLARRASQ